MRRLAVSRSRPSGFDEKLSTTWLRTHAVQNHYGDIHTRFKRSCGDDGFSGVHYIDLRVRCRTFSPVSGSTLVDNELHVEQRWSPWPQSSKLSSIQSRNARTYFAFWRRQRVHNTGQDKLLESGVVDLRLRDVDGDAADVPSRLE